WTRFSKGTPNAVGPLVRRECRGNGASPPLQFPDQVLRHFGKGRGREPHDGVFAFGWRISWGSSAAVSQAGLVKRPLISTLVIVRYVPFWPGLSQHRLTFSSKPSSGRNDWNLICACGVTMM